MTDEALDTLITRYLDGICTQAEAQELRDAMAQSPAAAQRFARLTYHEQSLQSLFLPANAATASAAAAEAAGRTPPAPARPAHRKPAPRRLRSANTPSRAALAAVFAAAAIAALALFLLHNISAQPAPAAPTPDRPLPAQALVRVSPLPSATAGADAPRAQAPGQPAKILQGGEELPADSRLQTGATAVTLLLLDDGTTLTAGPHTTLRPTRTPDGNQVTLESGRLQVIAAHQPPGRRLLFTTPQATAQVVGTRFDLIADGDGTQLAVVEGAVQLSNHAGDRQLVAAGESWRVGNDDRLAALPPTPDALPGYDFEKTVDSHWHGTRVAVPAAADAVGEFCLRAVHSPKFHVWLAFWADDDAPLFRVDPDQAIEFDYLLTGSRPPWVNLTMFYSADQVIWTQNADQLEPGIWHHARLPMRAFTCDRQPGLRLTAGTPINYVQLQIPYAADRQFFIDNLRLTGPSAKPKPQP